MFTRIFSSIVIGLLIFPCLISAATIPPVAWNQTICTMAMSSYTAVAMDPAGNVFVSGCNSGYTYGVNTTDYKNFIAKYDRNGTLLWDNVYPSDRGSMGLAVDQSGNVFTSDGRNIKKFNASGGLAWTSPLSSAVSWCGGITTDSSGNSYVTGSIYDPTQNAFVSKLDPLGNVLWTTSLHTSNTSYSYSIAVDSSGNSMIAATEFTAPHTAAGFAAKFDSAGNKIWSQDFAKNPSSVAIDSQGAAYLTVGNSLIKYNAANQQQWAKTSSLMPFMAYLALDPNGAEYVDGQNGILKFDSNGNILESYSYDTGNSNFAYGNGRITLTGTNFLPPDYSISSYITNLVVPEPSVLALLGMGSFGFLAFGWRKR